MKSEKAHRRAGSSGFSPGSPRPWAHFLASRQKRKLPFGGFLGQVLREMKLWGPPPSFSSHYPPKTPVLPYSLCPFLHENLLYKKAIKGTHSLDTQVTFNSLKWASQVVLVIKNTPANAEDPADAGLIPVSGRSPGGGNVNLLQCFCLGNSRDSGAWWATVHGFEKSQTWLINWANTQKHMID